jgi:acyl-CoA synthetase (AMP-forming)/AMP-acid ligase II
MTAWSILEMASLTVPDRVAFQDGGEALTFQQLEDRARCGASLIGLRKAESLVFIGVNGLAWPTLLFAAALADVPVVPLNYRLSFPSLAALVDRLERPLIVTDAQFERLSSNTELFVSTEEWTELTTRTDSTRAVEVSNERIRPAAILFTSGTTSEPKGVLLDHGHLFNYVIQTVEFGSAGDHDAALVSVPPYHVAGVGSILSNVFAGRRVVYLPEFSPSAWLETVRQQSVTQAMLVPTMMSRIVDELGTAPAALPTLRAVAYGGAAMPRSVLERALKALPDVEFTNAYGLTETSSTIALLAPKDHRVAMISRDEGVRARLGSAGRPVPGVELQIIDELGEKCVTGQVGELIVRGPQVSGTYLDTVSAVDADGWFHTRDQARLDDDGYLFVLGRLDDTIIRGGENIAPAEIESVLRGHPGIRDVAVVGFPDEEWGERTVAVVIASESGVKESDVREWARDHLRGSRTPDEVLFVDALPYNSLGKLIRRELVAELLKESSQETR